jgi:hypothetical protein
MAAESITKKGEKMEKKNLVKVLVETMKSANAIKIDGGPLLSSWEMDNGMLFANWEEDGLDYEEEIDLFDPDTSVEYSHDQDVWLITGNDGTETRINAYRLEPLKPRLP